MFGQNFTLLRSKRLFFASILGKEPQLIKEGKAKKKRPFREMSLGNMNLCNVYCN
jgi:hypothetical protein